jgi:hypothetical protein
MTTRTRNFMIGSAAVLVTGLGVGLVAYYGGMPGTSARQAGPAELSYMPANAAVVAYANVGDVMRSDLRERLRAVMPEEDKSKGRKEFQEATGIDIEKDIDSVLAVLVSDGDNRMPIVAIRGRFDEGRIEALAREHGATVDTATGARVITMPPDRPHKDQAEGEQGKAEEGQKADEGGKPARHRHGDFHPAMAFVEPGLVLLGNEEAVKAGASRKTGANLTSNAELMARIEKLDRGANAWAIGRFDALAGKARLPDEVAAQMPPMTWFQAAGHVNGGIRGVLRAETRDEASAKNLRDFINGIVALGKMQAQNKPEFNALIQSISLGGQGNAVELSFTVPTELIDAMAARSKAKVKTIAYER